MFFEGTWPLVHVHVWLFFGSSFEMYAVWYKVLERMHPPVADLLFFLRFFELECDVDLPILGVDRELAAACLASASQFWWNWRWRPCAKPRAHGQPQTWVSHHFPRFNIRRLWRLSGRFLKQVLEDLARSLIHIIASSAGYGLMCCGLIEGSICPGLPRCIAKTFRLDVTQRHLLTLFFPTQQKVIVNPKTD